MSATLIKTLLAAALTAGVLAGTATPACASAPLAATASPGFQRFMLGRFEVTVLSDGTIDLPVDELLHQPAANTRRALDKAFLGTPLETSVNAYLVNTGTRLVLIDAGTGRLFGPTLGKLAANLKASGYRPEDVDDILVTHLHPDHAGGLAPDGARAFPNATVHVERREADFWLSKARMDAAPAQDKPFFQGAMASIGPYQQAGRVATFSGDTELVPGIRSTASAGHTAGHSAYVVESQGQKLLLVGDLIHVAAVQLDHPEVTIAYDSDAPAAAATRARVFGDAAREQMLIGASHINFPGVGRLRAAGSGYEWVPANYTRAR